MSGDPSSPRPEVSEMQAKAEVCNALMGGTAVMRAAGRRYLPQEPKETDDAWTSRCNRTALFPAFRDAVDSMVGKPLGKPIAIEDAPDAIVEALENADLAGRDLDTFARAWFGQSLVDGIGWALVDYPRVPVGASLADEMAMNARPYLVHIPLSMVCGWKTEMSGGHNRLVQFRWREAIEEPDGEFGTKTAERVKVWEPGLVRVFVNDGGGWKEDPRLGGPVSIGEVPIVCFAPGRTGFFTRVRAIGLSSPRQSNSFKTGARVARSCPPQPCFAHSIAFNSLVVFLDEPSE